MSRYKNSEKRKQARRRKEANAEAEVKYKEILTKRRKVREVKKQPAEEMLLKVEGIAIMYGSFNLPVPVRDPLEWKPLSFNKDKQFIDFITRTYCKYKPPLFMFAVFTKVGGWAVSRREICEYFKWFKIIANGDSFYKQVKDFMTKKEAHIFLNLKNDSQIEENIWRAKCLATGMRSTLTGIIVNKISYPEYRFSLIFNQLPFFVKRFIREIDKNSLSDVIDFLIYKNRTDPSFDLKNRTFGSLVKLSNDWHREQQALRNEGANFELARCSIPDFEWHEKKEDVVWEIRQLLTSNELYKEGAKMRHCVGGYASPCREGYSYIFSMTKSDFINTPERRLTIELNNRHEIMQSRGKCNRLPDGEENRVIRKWCIKNNIRYA